MMRRIAAVTCKALCILHHESKDHIMESPFQSKTSKNYATKGPEMSESAPLLTIARNP